LLAKGNFLELVEAVALRSTVDDSVLEEIAFYTPVIDSALGARAIFFRGWL
jgi:hypothetical protein